MDVNTGVKVGWWEAVHYSVQLLCWLKRERTARVISKMNASN